MSLDDAIDAAAAQRLSRGGQARYASLEAVAGNIYLAIIVAGLVGSRLREQPRRDARS